MRIYLYLIFCTPFFLQKSAAQEDLFTLLGPEETNVGFVNKVPSFEKMNVLISQYHYNGGGVCIGDINNDDLPDIFLNANFGPDKLYLNLGDMNFKDISETAGISGKVSWETGINMIDINNDGFLDIFICRSGHAPDAPFFNLLYLNNGDLTFSERALDYSLFDISHSTQSYFFDYDLDGDLDLYLLNHNPQRTWNYDFSVEEMSRDDQVGDKLFNNEGGKFVEVSEEAGIIGKSISYGLGALIGDMNNDRYPDIYICNDFGERDYFYINQGDGTFTEQLIESIDHISWYSMGGDIADINNDGLLDLMILDMTAEDNFRQKTNMNDMNPEKFRYAVENGLHYQYMINTLQLNLGNHRFSDIAFLSGVAYSDWSWAPLFADFNMDGHKDLYITNGYRVDISNKDFGKWFDKRQRELQALDPADRDFAKELQEALDQLPKKQIPNYMFSGDGNLSFTNQTQAWNLDDPSFSNGAAYGDLDADGDLDLVVSNIDHEAFIYRNNAIEDGRGSFLKIKLEGPLKNVMGIGSKIRLFTTSGTQHQELYPARGFLSSVEPVLHFGLGNTDPVRVEVTWYDGSITVYDHPERNSTILIKYDDRKTVTASAGEEKRILFEDVTEELGVRFMHRENQFDDYFREILLPHKMSQMGPALCVGDVNGDDLDDFFIGGAHQQPSALFVQQENRFEKLDGDFWARQKHYEDVAAEFIDVDSDGDLDLYIVSGGYHMEPDDPVLQDRLYINDSKGHFALAPDGTVPAFFVSGGCVTKADMDGDGDDDLFVGGRAVPGRYPLPPRSVILRNDNGIFRDVTAEVCPEIEYIGMVTDGTWADFNGDQIVDLAISGEWMEPCIFINRDGNLNRVPTSGKSGWWFDVTTTDMDGDNDLDLLYGNLGTNYKYQASDDRPFQIYCSDFDESGSLDIVLGYYNRDTLYPVRGRQCSAQQMPFIAETFKTYEDFGRASLVDIYGDKLSQSEVHYQVTDFRSMIAINDGQGHFDWQPLPRWAQIAPIRDAIPLDYNADERTDFLLIGNLFQSEVETPRADAGKGWLMEGLSENNFRIVHPAETGIFAEGDVRRIEKIDFGSRSIYLVARNNGKLSAISADDTR